MILSARYHRALALAYELHHRQLRKGSNVPYLSHLLAVSSLALEHGAGEDEAIAALLHDAVEDQGGLATLDRIRAELGDAVAEIVLGCTDSVATPRPPWRARKEAYLVHLGSASPSVRLVSSCDKLHNARTLLTDFRLAGDALWSRFTGGREGTRWYYDALAARFLELGAPPAAELRRTVDALLALT